MKIAQEGLKAFLGEGASLESAGKVTTTWGNLKSL